MALFYNHDRETFMPFTNGFSNEYNAYLLRINSNDNHPVNDDYLKLLELCIRLDLVNHAGTDSGMTALHRAVLACNIDKIRLLKLAGADPDLRSHPPRSQTPIDLANMIIDKNKKEQILTILTSKEVLSDEKHTVNSPVLLKGA